MSYTLLLNQIMLVYIINIVKCYSSLYFVSFAIKYHIRMGLILQVKELNTILQNPNGGNHTMRGRPRCASQSASATGTGAEILGRSAPVDLYNNMCLKPCTCYTHIESDEVDGKVKDVVCLYRA